MCNKAKLDNDTMLPSSGLRFCWFYNSSMLTNVSYFLTAPSAAPELDVVDIRYSQVKLRWDEIPLNETNGIIQGYTIYFWNDTDNVRGIHGFREVDSRFLDGNRFLNSYFINHNVSILFKLYGLRRPAMW